MKNKYSIIFACDKNFLFTFSIALMSIKKYSHSTLQNTDIILFYNGLEQADFDFINKIHPVIFKEYHFPLNINMNDTNFKKYTQLAYARYEAFTMLDEYEKILYMDVDTIVTGNLDYIFENFCNNNGIAFAYDEQKGLEKITKNFKKPMSEYNMDIRGYNSGVILFSNKLINRKEIKEWCYQETVNMLDNLICTDQGILNLMLQKFNIIPNILPDICNCMPACKKYMDKRYRDKVIIYHCAGGGVRFWRYSYYPRWQELYNKYLEMGGKPHTAKEKPWLIIIKKYKLYKYDFFNESPNPYTHIGKFVKYLISYPFYYIFYKK